MDYRGSFGEPYCSIGCQLLGGTEAIQALMEGRSGKCGVCGKTVQVSPYEDRGSIVANGGDFLFLCPGCLERGKVMVASKSTCSRCGDPIA